jgi:hypothetical protein
MPPRDNSTSLVFEGAVVVLVLGLCQRLDEEAAIAGARRRAVAGVDRVIAMMTHA